MSNVTITTSTELMKNFQQSLIMAPDADFVALQTNSGLSVLLSLSSDGKLYATAESTANSASGWTRTDISQAQITHDFPAPIKTKITHIATAQAVADGTMGLGMVVSDGTNDHLYLSLGNSDTNTTWVTTPLWAAYPFDDPNNPLTTVSIVGVDISEASDGQYIVVDVLRNAQSQPALVFRYYIDVKKANGYAWHAHDIAVDLQATRYTTCLGRQAGQMIDGLYTSGQVNTSPQFTYQPLYNVWNPAIPAAPSRLNLPGGLVPEGLAACRNSDNSTDLYVSAQDKLFYFASTNQSDQATGVQIGQSTMFSGVTKLFSYTAGLNTVVWGLNGSDQAFYLTCPIGQQTSTGAWSVPLPIATDVDLLSPYINRNNSANEFFAAANTLLYRYTQDPDTGLWSRQPISLPPPSVQQPARKFSSYTTRIQVTDGQQQPLAGHTLAISALRRCAFFVNHLYYVLDTTPVSINTDANGSITLVEAVEGLTATRLTIVDGSNPSVSINPMDKPMAKIAGLSSADKVQGALIQSSDGSTRNLVSGATAQQLTAVAQSVVGLSTAYSKQSLTGGRALSHSSRRAGMLAAPAPMGFESAIAVEFGDLVRWLESGVEYLVQIVEDAASDTWHFICTIAGEVYRATLDCIEAVASAVQWVFNMVKTAIADLIAFLEFLFEWADITSTKAVFKNIVKLWLSDQVSQIGTVKSEFDSMIAQTERVINGWAGISNWGGLGDAATSPMTQSSNTTIGMSAPSTLLSGHYQNNASNLTQTNPPPPPLPQANVIQILFNALQAEGNVMDSVLDQLSALADQWSSLSLEQSLSKLLVIFADGVLSSAQVVVDALLDIVQSLANAALAVLDTPIYIPVVSDILADFGVPELSMLDLFCWTAAVPVTVGYKLTHGSAPFPDNSDTTFLVNATSFSQILNAMAPALASAPSALTASAASARTMVQGQGQSLEMAVAAPAGVAASVGPLSLSPNTASSIFMLGHSMAGFFTLMSCFIDPIEASDDTGDTTLAVASGILALLAGAGAGAAVVLAPQHPIQSSAVNWINRATLGCRVIAKLIFSGPAQTKFGTSTGVMKNLKVGDGRATGAIVDAILVIPALLCSCWHFYELSEISASAGRSNAIVEETANVTAYISRLGYSTAVNTEGTPKLVAIGVMVAANACYMGLELAEAVIGFQPDGATA